MFLYAMLPIESELNKLTLSSSQSTTDSELFSKELRQSLCKQAPLKECELQHLASSLVNVNDTVIRNLEKLPIKEQGILVNTLLKGLKTRNKTIRKHCARSLLRLDPKLFSKKKSNLVITHLISYLDSSDPFVKLVSAEALGHFVTLLSKEQCRRIVPALLRVMHSKDDDNKLASALTLMRLGAYIKNNNIEISNEVICHLGMLANPILLNKLLQLKQEPQSQETEFVKHAKLQALSATIAFAVTGLIPLGAIKQLSILSQIGGEILSHFSFLLFFITKESFNGSNHELHEKYLKNVGSALNSSDPTKNTKGILIAAPLMESNGICQLSNSQKSTNGLYWYLSKDSAKKRDNLAPQITEKKILTMLGNLLIRIQNENNQIRLNSIQAIVQIAPYIPSSKYHEVVITLVKGLQLDNFLLNESSEKILALIGSHIPDVQKKQLIDTLLNRLNDDNLGTKLQAITALGILGPKMSKSLISNITNNLLYDLKGEWSQVKNAKAVALGLVGPHLPEIEIPKYVKALLIKQKQFDWTYKLNIIKALRLIAPYIKSKDCILTIAVSFIEGLQNNVVQVRNSSAAALGSITSQLTLTQRIKTVGLVVNRLNKNWEANATALGLMVPYVPNEQQTLIINALLDMLHDDEWDSDKSCVTVSVIGKSPKKSSDRMLIRGLSELSQAIIRAESARTLGLIASNIPEELMPKVIDYLLNGLKYYRHEIFGQACAEALGRLASNIIPTQKPSIVIALLDGLGNKDWTVRAASAKGLGLITPSVSQTTKKIVVNGLLKTLHDPNAIVRMNSAEALGSIAPQMHHIHKLKIVNVLQAKLNDKSWQVGEVSAIALAKVIPQLSKPQKTRIVNALLKQVNSANWEMAEYSATALGNTSQYIPKEVLLKVVTALIVNMKNNPAEYVREACAGALTEILPMLSFKELTSAHKCNGAFNELIGDVEIFAEQIKKLAISKKPGLPIPSIKQHTRPS